MRWRIAFPMRPSFPYLRHRRRTSKRQSPGSVMARPRYMICSEGQSVDQLTSLASHFNIIEKLTAVAGSEVAPGAVQTGSIKVWLAAVWMREEDDQPEDDFEFELSIA